MEYRLKAHVPPETTYALATQHEQKLDKQHEIDMPNAIPSKKSPDATIYHLLSLGVALGGDVNIRVRVRSAGVLCWVCVFFLIPTYWYRQHKMLALGV